ncbi:hypothetical protein GIB67_026429 [Kingdonia uniflora]|uniref:Uncharacterized protein n=1 Tax=Kingdonia uniflora TaxID=39325 RepID=A0A7J7P684_9MAGN|nr:hypothetical protein GIB67_026429 [Kingdonia uniflora]
MAKQAETKLKPVIYSSFTLQQLPPRQQQRSFFSLGQLANGNLDKPSTDYDVNGEGLREAIKNGDTAAVKKLLAEGVDANYCDKKGFSLLHLAAVFNQTEIAFLLMDHGASMDCKNQQDGPMSDAPHQTFREKISFTKSGGGALEDSRTYVVCISVSSSSSRKTYTKSVRCNSS